MADPKQKRIIDLQRQLRVAREALARIKLLSHDGRIIGIADQALEQMWPLEPKQPLQHLVGHERRNG